MSQELAAVLSRAGDPQTTDLKTASADRKRVTKAALDFEGLLLANWLQAVDEGNRALAGNEESAGAETMGAMGMQALASGLAARGGIGLARMLLAHLPVAADLPVAAGANAVESAARGKGSDE